MFGAQNLTSAHVEINRYVIALCAQDERARAVRAEIANGARVLEEVVNPPQGRVASAVGAELREARQHTERHDHAEHPDGCQG